MGHCYVHFAFLFTLNEHIDWSDHNAKIANKISRTIGILKKLQNILPSSILFIMYNSLILPQLHYCLTVWGFESNRLYKLQKKAIRTITKSKFNAHTEPLFKRVSLLKLSDIFKIQCLKLFLNVRHQHLPYYFLSFFTLIK